LVKERKHALEGLVDTFKGKRDRLNKDKEKLADEALSSNRTVKGRE